MREDIFDSIESYLIASNKTIKLSELFNALFPFIKDKVDHLSPVYFDKKPGEVVTDEDRMELVFLCFTLLVNQKEEWQKGEDKITALEYIYKKGKNEERYRRYCTDILIKKQGSLLMQLLENHLKNNSDLFHKWHNLRDNLRKVLRNWEYKETYNGEERFYLPIWINNPDKSEWKIQEKIYDEQFYNRLYREDLKLEGLKMKERVEKILLLADCPLTYQEILNILWRQLFYFSEITFTEFRGTTLDGNSIQIEESFSDNLFYPDSLIEEMHAEEMSMDFIKKLSPKEVLLFKLSSEVLGNGEELSNDEIGKKLGISGERVRQLRKSLVQKLDVFCKEKDVVPHILLKYLISSIDNEEWDKAFNLSFKNTEMCFV